jgi:hypothetical protein
MKITKVEELSFPQASPITSSLSEAINSVMEVTKSGNFTKDDVLKAAHYHKQILTK